MADGKLQLRTYLEKLLRARPNDAVKLAFMPPDKADGIGRLDLSLLSELKRGTNGTVEIKLVDRAEILEKLAELEKAEREENSAGANFYAALDEAARLLNTTTEKSGGGDNEV